MAGTRWVCGRLAEGLPHSALVYRPSVPLESKSGYLCQREKNEKGGIKEWGLPLLI